MYRLEIFMEHVTAMDLLLTRPPFMLIFTVVQST